MGTPNNNSEGKFTGFIGHCFDIDERKKLEFELIAAKEKAEESDRLKSSFLANLSHEIRTPMNSIMGFASLLPEEELPEQKSNYANIIVRSSEQLLHIIDDIVIYSKLQTRLFSFFPTQFNLNQLLEEIKQAFDLPEFKKETKLIIELPEDNCCQIYSDFEKLKQLLSNLVSNAYKYTPSGSITIGYRYLEDNTLLYVKDTGIGIPNIEKERIFERFFRGSNIDRTKVTGTGLGLSIVKELIQLLGGSIWVESNINEGSTFFISIPKL